MTDDPVRGGTVQSVERALEVLEALAAAGGAIGVTEVARRVGLPQGTTHRLLLTLAARGYARREADRKYAVGVAALQLGGAAYQELTTVAEQHLPLLVKLSGETSNLALLEGDQMVYVAQSPSPHTLRIFAEVGRRVPVHSTSVGKAVLAAMPPDRARAVMAGLRLDACTPRTASTLPELEARVEQAREDGFAVDDEEQELGVRCVGVALPRVRGLHVAASVSGPSDRFTLERAREVGVRLPRAVAGLAAALAGGEVR
jgi:IclR family acetate operon transcriptional repressor